MQGSARRQHQAELRPAAGTSIIRSWCVEATLNQATLKGLDLPPDAPPPTIYIAIRNGRLSCAVHAGEVLTIEGDGSCRRRTTPSTGSCTSRSRTSRSCWRCRRTPPRSRRPATRIIELKLGGKLSPVEALHRRRHRSPTLNLRVSEHEFTPRAPLRLGLREGRIVFDSFELQRTDSSSRSAASRRSRSEAPRDRSQGRRSKPRCCSCS